MEIIRFLKNTQHIHTWKKNNYIKKSEIVGIPQKKRFLFLKTVRRSESYLHNACLIFKLKLKASDDVMNKLADKKYS